VKRKRTAKQKARARHRHEWGRGMTIARAWRCDAALSKAPQTAATRRHRRCRRQRLSARSTPSVPDPMSWVFTPPVLCHPMAIVSAPDTSIGPWNGRKQGFKRSAPRTQRSRTQGNRVKQMTQGFALQTTGWLCPLDPHQRLRPWRCAVQSPASSASLDCPGRGRAHQDSKSIAASVRCSLGRGTRQGAAVT
jgi:hypothetical protein